MVVWVKLVGGCVGEFDGLCGVLIKFDGLLVEWVGKVNWVKFGGWWVEEINLSAGWLVSWEGKLGGLVFDIICTAGK